MLERQGQRATYSVVNLNEGVVDGNDIDSASVDAVKPVRVGVVPPWDGRRVYLRIAEDLSKKEKKKGQLACQSRNYTRRAEFRTRKRAYNAANTTETVDSNLGDHCGDGINAVKIVS